MSMQCLLNEHLPQARVNTDKQHDPANAMVHIGDADVTLLGTADFDLLIVCAAEQRTVVIDNRSTMPVHVANHFAVGRDHWGRVEFEVRDGTACGHSVCELQVLWGASEADEWIDRQVWIPM